MFRTAVAFTALTAFSVVSAQANSNSTFKLDNPSEVDLGVRANWCNAQTAACGNLCETISDQSCDVNTLDFTCVCSNDESPDFNQYTDTMPFFVCKQLFQDCITDHPDDATAQKNCTTTYDDNCGTESPANATKIDAQTSTTAAPSSTGASETSNAGSEATSSSSEGGAMPTNMPIQHIGNGVAAVAVGLFAYML